MPSDVEELLLLIGGTVGEIVSNLQRVFKVFLSSVGWFDMFESRSIQEIEESAWNTFQRPDLASHPASGLRRQGRSISIAYART